MKDVINYTKDFVVVSKAPAYIAARLRVSEKDFVVDHAQSWSTTKSFLEMRNRAAM